MKKILQLTLACASVGILWLSGNSCATDYDAAPNVPGRDTMKNYMRGDFTAMIDVENNFIADWKYVNDVTTDGIRTVTVTGIMDSYNKDPETFETISLSIYDYKGPNVYPIVMGVSGNYIRTNAGVPSSYLAKTGDTLAYIQITQDQGSMAGSFNFVVAPGGLGTDNNYSISGGSFNIPK